MSFVGVFMPVVFILGLIHLKYKLWKFRVTINLLIANPNVELPSIRYIPYIARCRIGFLMINLEWYRSFIEVYRVGTVSGAAQVLHLTQPAVSQHLAALESALGNQLFQRTPRRMVPTEAGKRLYSQVVSAIEKLESIPHKNSTAETPQTIRIGTPQEFFTEQILAKLP